MTDGRQTIGILLAHGCAFGSGELNMQTFSLNRKYNLSFLYIRNFKPQAIFCNCTGWFVSDQVDRWSCKQGSRNKKTWLWSFRPGLI